MATKGTEFQVKLAGVKLSGDVEKRIAMQIRSLVLAELAKLDLRGDLAIRPGIRLRPQLYGIWIDGIRRPGGGTPFKGFGPG